jgi:myo-inositol catabolism protein IolC
MAAPSWTRPLMVFAMDHRDSYRTLLGLPEPHNAVELLRARDVKTAVFAGFADAVEAMPAAADRDGVALLIDVEYGEQLFEPARRLGALVCLPLERSGQAELQWEYGDDSASIVDQYRPDLVKILMRYNADGDVALNARQADRAAQMSAWCHARNLPLMLEVLIPPTTAQRALTADDPAAWDAKLRPDLQLRAVDELRATGSDPSIWKVEGLDDPADARAMVAAARAGGRDDVSCIVLGRGADLDRIEQWLAVGAATDGYVGFAVGRSLWNASAQRLWRGECDADFVRTEVAANYTRLCDFWTRARG